MPPVVSIVGKSDSGKTTLLEKIVAEITRRGHRVGSIKHDTHGFEIDHKGKDSWRHKQAGSSTVVISSPWKLAVVKDTDQDTPLNHLAATYFDDVDIIFTEGFKREAKLKVEVFRKDAHHDLLCEDDEDLIAIMTDQEFAVKAPVFDINDIKSLADLIENRFLKAKQAASVSLFLDGKYAPLKPFIQEMFINSITGMVASLKGGNGVRSIQISVTLSGE